MNSRRLVTVIIVLASVSGRTQVALPQGLSDDQVVQAIREASTAILLEVAVCLSPRHAAGGFEVCIQGPFNRVTQLAWSAQKEHHTLTVGDVDADTRALTWRVVVTPNEPHMAAGHWIVTPAATDVLIERRSHRKATLLRAVSLNVLPSTLPPISGATFEGRTIAATFDPVRLPPGDLDVVILTTAQTRRYTLHAKDREDIR
jgi:hypothetical protein